ncbi:MAG TPA: hypothetical protein VI603_03395 [Saprospiraceae bacterium]|nr:hypothetical protein [Saprospiraceae bacterium]
MKHVIIYTISTLLMCAAPAWMYAQTPTDAIMMNKGDICFGLIYDHGEWDQYWQGKQLLKNGNVGTLTRTTVLPMFAYGIIDNVNLLIGVPYVKTKSDGGQLTGDDGMQDLSIALKVELMEKQLWKGKLYLLPVAEFSTPVSNYLSDYQPYSLGLHTDHLSLRGILQYKLDMGLYLRGSIAHLWRTETKIERDYYYNNGSYYTEWMDVPNAWNYQATAGIWLFNDALKIEGNYTWLRSTSGDDIRAWNPGQPTNKVEVNEVGGSIQYRIPQLPGLGIYAHYSTIVEGRNMGKFTNIGGGLTYQFKLF